MQPYDHKQIEPKWQKIWEKNKAGKAVESKKKKFYSLIEFPYPSGDGLHVGHIRSNTAMDIISHKRRREGYEVLYPIGWDAFGLPTENYAIKTGIQPALVTQKNTDTFRRQLKSLGFFFDWSREINTTDPKYYQWTQWIFLQFLKEGLAYKKKMTINWCPKDLIGLANEEVIDGKCERCGTPVEKREKEQWMLAITKYADKLLAGLDAVEYDMPKLIDKNNPYQPDKPTVKRDTVHAIVFDPQSKKYLTIRNKKFGWDTVIIGGIEKNETPVEAALREVREETGHVDLEFKRLLGGPVETHYYAKHKDENRIAITQGIYFELKSNKKVDISPREDKNDEIIWIDEKDFTPEKLVNSEMPLWIERLRDPKAGLPMPLLDWPESIKQSQRNWIGKSEGAEFDFNFTKKYTYILLHGYKGTPQDSIYPWLKSQLEKKGHTVLIPPLPNSANPTEDEQVSAALEVMESMPYGENTILYGHSLGTVVAMKVVEKLKSKIAGLVLAGGFVDPEFSDHPRGFTKNFTWKFDHEKIKNNTGFITILHDVHDVAISNEQAERLGTLLNTPIQKVTAEEPHFDGDTEPTILRALLPSLTVFTTRPDTLFGVTYIVVAPENQSIKNLLPYVKNRKEIEEYIIKAKNKTDIIRTDTQREKTGVKLEGIDVINPANNEHVPVWIADYVLADYGTGSVMAVPAHDQRDWDFSKKYALPVKKVITSYEEKNDTLTSAYVGEGVLINSGKFDGKKNTEAKREITSAFGIEKTTYKLRDWVFSRQRYWGEPIPVIHCPECGMVPVPEKDLPVKLPEVKNYKPTETGESPLATIPDWVNVKCPKCKSKNKKVGLARRETDTMPNWAGSSWYYLRYTDPHNTKAFAGKGELEYWTPVDWYNGGMEHTTLHLLYSRFWHAFLFDQGLVPTSEPYKKRTSHGLILAKGGEKMSKSKGNVVNPDGIIEVMGADSLRLYEMFMGPFEQAIAWDENGIVGCRRFIERVWKLAEKVINKEEKSASTNASTSAADTIVNRTIKKVSEDIESMRFNTAVSALMIAVNDLEKIANNSDGTLDISPENVASILLLLAPFIPHVTEELWYKGIQKSLWKNSSETKSIHDIPWPQFDPKKIVEATSKIAIQINGKTRSLIEINNDELETLSEAKMSEKVTALDEIKKWIYGKEIKKVIYIKGRLINIVIA